MAGHGGRGLTKKWNRVQQRSRDIAYQVHGNMLLQCHSSPPKIMESLDKESQMILAVQAIPKTSGLSIRAAVARMSLKVTVETREIRSALKTWRCGEPHIFCNLRLA